MWRIFCLSAAMGIGISFAVTFPELHLFANNGSKNTSTDKSKSDNSENDFWQAASLFQKEEYEKVLKYLQRHEKELSYSTPNGKKWVDLAVDVNNALLNDTRLTLLYTHFPEPFNTREVASLRVANSLILSRKSEAYAELRNHWKGNERFPVEWLLLDVDALLLNNQHAEAIKLLESQSFTGEIETNRLVRLALLSIQNDPQAAWKYLNEANEKDPENIDVYTYKARLLESVGKKNQALSEYQNALQVNSNNIFMKDLLADFFIRQGQHAQAIALWKESQENASLDRIWLKALFWNRVTTPSQADLSKAELAFGKLHDFNMYLLELPLNQFWNQSQFEKIPNSDFLLSSQQATFWLRLIDHLKKGEELAALKLLEGNIFANESWNAPLEKTLKQLLIYRTSGSFPLNKDEFFNEDDESGEENAFFALISALAVQPDLILQEKGIKELLSSKEVFVVTFLSTGWLETGLFLRDQAILPNNLPDWVAVAITEAIHTNRGYEEALQFAMMQPSTPQLSELMLDLLKLATHNKPFLFKLNKLASNHSEEGVRAAWLLSLIHIERGDYKAAKQTIQNQTLLSAVHFGKETLARIALLEGNQELAHEIYLEIEPHSAEAKSYLAGQAFNEKDWERAHSLTKQLLVIYPNHPVLQENLYKIAQAALDH